MRLIKFRGKRLDDGRWAYGDLSSRYLSPKLYIVQSKSVGVTFWHEVDPNTVGQFTGDFDEDGNEIYE